MANNWNVNSKLLEGCALYVIFSTFAARRLRLKSSSLHMSLCGNISIDDCSRELFKPSKDSASLWICNEKNFGFWILCEWRHKWSSFGPFWSISSGHRHKPRDGSFSLNTLALGCFWGFSKKKTPKRAWLFAGISPLLYGLRTWSKRQKMRQVF